MIEVRMLQPGDRERVLELAERLTTGVAPWREAGAVAATVTGWVADAVRDHDARDAPVCVAVEDERVLGFVVGGTRTHWAGGVDAYIGELVTDSAVERRGVGRALIGAIEAWARERGFDRVTLETGAANRGAIEFYERLGYQHEEVVLTRALGA